MVRFFITRSTKISTCTRSWCCQNENNIVTFDPVADFSEDYCNYKTDNLVLDRIIFNLKPNKNKELIVVNCSIERNIPFSRNDYTSDVKPVKSGLDVRFFRNGRVYAVGKSSRSSFDFSFTGIDSDIEVFAPHVELFERMYNQFHGDEKHTIMQAVGRIFTQNYRTTTGISKRKKGKMIGNLKAALEIEIPKLKERVQNSFENMIDLGPGVEREVYMTKHYLIPIAKTIANVLVETRVQQIFEKLGIDLEEKKENPHMRRKEKT